MDTNDGNDDEAFFRGNAALIAKLLLEQEESGVLPVKTQQGKAEAVHGLYRELCFDEPMLLDGDLEATSRDLTSKLVENKPSQPSTHAFALSNRFVDGVVNFCRKDRDSTPNPAMAGLLYTVLVRVPLLCCQAKNLNKIQRFLGSYKGVENIMSENPFLDTSNNNETVGKTIRALGSMAIHEDTDMETASGNIDNTNDPNGIVQEPNVGGDKYEEVWAAESDPSDYDFDEGQQNVHHFQSQQAFDMFDTNAMLIDPEALSKPDTSMTYEQAQVAVTSLLRQANYSLLSPLFQQKDDKLIEELVQLTLILLTDSTPLINNEMQSQGLYPLWMLRDAAIQNIAFVPPYLDLIQTLLGVDEAQKQSKHQIAPATIVGLTSLATWCSEEWKDASIRSKNYVATHGCIVQSLNELAGILEKAIADKDNIVQRNHIRGNLTPILEILGNMSWSGKGKVSQTALNMCSVSRRQAPQALLNSGIFRQLLELAMSSETTEHLMINFRFAILFVCIESPTVLGRYCWRYPGFASTMVRMKTSSSSSSYDGNLFLAILWNAFATNLVSPAPTQIRWKTKGGAPTEEAISLSLCQELCSTYWEKFCGLVAAGLRKAISTMTYDEHTFTLLQDFERLANCLVQSPSLSKQFIGIADQSCMDTILDALSRCPSEAHNLRKEKIDDDEDEMELSEDKKSNPVLEMTSSARRTVKQLTLVFQTMSNATSKTD